jgi:hypothetical protein
MRWAVRGQSVVKASVCSVPRTSTKMRSERFVVRRKERTAISEGHLHSALHTQFVAWLGLAQFRVT